ncbi:sodium-dependent proline transporter-like [Ostrinia furnacalis]|uniref:sodium-dependent proline transporter-like n=1 Tax=Ostrinia furnacalis TaxID=93504 RepID=UPI00103EBC95|nr:sodium-dependent proline transporter-like [Ostrinia furnacalis]
MRRIEPCRGCGRTAGEPGDHPEKADSRYTTPDIVYFTVIFPYVVLFCLFVRGVTLPGAWNGISFYIFPDWDQLRNPKVWADAATQLFYSLGPGWGGLVSMASFNRFNYKNLRSSITIPLVNSGTSIWAGFVVFSVLGFAAERTGVPVGQVANAGPGLAFITYPAAVSMMPAPNFWALAFFVMLFFLGIDTMFVTIEAVIAGVVDELPALRSRKRLITFLTCLIMFCTSIICNTEILA